jgi:NADH:ubiquinone oxidoreductase subunit K
MNKQTKTGEVLRWIAVLPGGILAGLLILFPLHWVLYFTLVRGSVIQMPMEDMAPIERFLSPALSAIFFVFGGALIAPKKQILVSYVLFSLSLLARIAIILVAIAQQIDFDLSTYGIFRLSIASLAGALGIKIVKLKAKKEDILLSGHPD